MKEVDESPDTSEEHGPLRSRLIPAVPGVRWAELRASAVSCAEHGWPVLPGTYQLGDRRDWFGASRSVGLEPVAELWATAAATNPECASEWWSRRPYSVLLVCGPQLCAVEVTAAHGSRALTHVDGALRGPVIASPYRTWLFLARDATPLVPALAEHRRTQLHGSGC